MARDRVSSRRAPARSPGRGRWVRTAGFFFPHAAAYAGVGATPADRIGEPGLPLRLVPRSERLLQCVWYDERLRPGGLRTSEGEALAVEHPGVWNLEAGPDFLGASVVVGPERRRLRGDVEVHLRPAGWREHGHAGDPRYARVRVHVTFLPGALPPGALPGGAVQVALREPLAAQPQFSFEDIDPAAYPYAARAEPTPCALALARLDVDEKGALLEAAGQERLRRKAERLAVAVRQRGPAQAFYEETLSVLGYRHNKGAGRRLAERVPLEALRMEAHGDPVRAYALLLGVSGLLPPAPRSTWDAETRAFLRGLWDRWWKQQNGWAHRALPRSTWRLGGLRPANHPARRLMAAAWLFTRKETPDRTLLAMAARGDGFGRRALAFLDTTVPGYWERRLGWSAAPRPRPVALLGRSRATALLVNAVVPLLAVTDAARPFARGLLEDLPPEADSGLVRTMAHTLFGPDHPGSWYRSGLRRQGLLQIFHDFCLDDRSRCAACAFPELLASFARDTPAAGPCAGAPGSR